MTVKDVERWVRDDIRQIQAYHVPDPGDAIKLDAMENPFPWPGELAPQWAEFVQSSHLNRYPDPAAKQLRAKLKTWLQLDQLACGDELEVLLGNGSDEIIQLLALLVQSDTERRCILAPEPGFVMYRMIATFAGLDYVPVPLQSNYQLDYPATLAAVQEHQPALVFLAYPNNPTGNLFDKAQLRELIAAAPGLVIADEAYTAFASDSLLDGLDEFPNLLVMRTMSKLGLAGLRLGFIVGRQGWLRELDKLRLPYNINTLTQQSALFALDNIEVLEAQAALLVEQRAWLQAALEQIDGVEVFASEANFLLLKVVDAAGVHQQLRERGLLIKKLHGAHPLLANALRVTVGSASENQAFVAALRELLA